jgi:hypothetical protein
MQPVYLKTGSRNLNDLPDASIQCDIEEEIGKHPLAQSYWTKSLDRHFSGFYGRA